MGNEDDRVELDELLHLACRLGASEARVIGASDIVVEDGLAELCRETTCENYGQSPGCPPHVSGPAGFRELLKGFRRAVVFRIEVPSQVLFSSERREVFRLLHEIAAEIRQAAVGMGYADSKAFAGGSCKRLFCEDHPQCRVLSEGGPCRNPGLAAPSMSGFGINVSRLMKAAGWVMNRASRESGGESESTGTACGLVLVG